MLGALALVTVVAMLLIRRVGFVKLAFLAFLGLTVAHSFGAVFGL